MQRATGAGRYRPVVFVGHFGLSFGAKRLAPSVSLGALFLAAQLADLVWPVLVLVGIEHVEIRPGITLVTPLDFVFYPISHSLVGLALWADGRLEEAEPKIRRRELEPVEVASHAPVRLHDEDDGGVAPLLLALVVLVLEARGLRDRFDRGGVAREKMPTAALRRVIASVLREDALALYVRLLERLVRVALAGLADEAQFRRYRADVGRGILLGLEFLVAADIIATVAIEPSLESLAILAGIVAIRTFLSLSLEVEVSGRWPWQQPPAEVKQRQSSK